MPMDQALQSAGLEDLADGRQVLAHFLARYRCRPRLWYLPPPAWVAGAATHALLPDIAVFAVDEMGKRNVCPIVFAQEPALPVGRRLLAEVAGLPHPARLELRVFDDSPLLGVAAEYGFATDRVQAGLRLELTGPSAPSVTTLAPGTGEVIAAAASPAGEELRDLYNACFGLALTLGDVERMRAHAAWDDRDIFVIRKQGRIVASLRLVLDVDGQGERYGLLRGLAVHPDWRRDSLAFLRELYWAAHRRLAEAGAGRCCLLVDRADERKGMVMRRLFARLGFVQDTLVYRLRQPAGNPPCG